MERPGPLFQPHGGPRPSRSSGGRRRRRWRQTRTHVGSHFRLVRIWTGGILLLNTKHQQAHAQGWNVWLWWRFKVSSCTKIGLKSMRPSRPLVCFSRTISERGDVIHKWAKRKMFRETPNSFLKSTYSDLTH